MTAPVRATRPGAWDAEPTPLAGSLEELKDSLRGLLAALLEKGYGQGPGKFAGDGVSAR